jgi:hypothetical protein
LLGERAALPGCAPMEQADRPEPLPSCLKLTGPAWNSDAVPGRVCLRYSTAMAGPR